MKRLIYISQSTLPETTEEDIEDILSTSTRNNFRLGITGALLHNAATFVQVLEGDHASVEDVFARIEDDARHHSVTLLCNEDVRSRWFGNWSMAYVALSGSASNGCGDVVSQMSGDDVLSLLSALVAGNIRTGIVDASLAAKVNEVRSGIALQRRAFDRL